ncbi:MAG TPA: SH3 domain-containing protein [Thermoanaerobaculia bacterium]|jgi:hypothetical protein|nr:SH3 domain-containing protein [Thermoanaerobaculia bacterium]
MRRALAILAWLCVAGLTVGTVWLVRHPESPILDPVVDWPWIGLVVEDLRLKPGPDPFAIPKEGSGEEREEASAPRRISPRRPPGAASGPDFPLPTDLQPEGVERVIVKPGFALRSEPRFASAPVATLRNVGILKVVERSPGWVKVSYGDVAGWVPDPKWSGSEPPLGSDPDPVLPVTGRPPDPDRLALARNRLAAPEVGGRLGPYLVYTDVRSPDRLAFLDRVTGGLEALYRARYGVEPVGEPAEVVILFDRETDYRAFLDEDAELAGLPATGHTALGIVALWDAGRPEAEVGATLVHELVHLLTRRAIGPALPSWIDEGIADDLSQSRIDPSGRLLPGTLGGITIQAGQRIEMHGARAALQNLIEASDTGTLRPLPELLGLEWREFVRQRAEQNYAQSSFFIRYLLQGEQGSLAAGFRSFLSEVAAGKPPEPERLREKLGRSWPALDAGFRLWLLSQREDRPLVP